MSLVDYGSSDSEGETEPKKEEEEPPKKPSLFKLPAPKNVKEIPKDTDSTEVGAKRKLQTFTVPINTQSLKKMRDEDKELDAGEKPKQKPQMSSTLSFLPAPKNANVVQKAPLGSGGSKLRSVNKRAPLSFRQNPLTSLLTQPQASQPDPIPVAEPVQETEATGQYPGYEATGQYPGYDASGQYPGYDASGQYSGYQGYSGDQYAQVYQQGYQQSAIGVYGGQAYSESNPSTYNGPVEGLPRDFRDFKNANVVDIVQDDRMKSWPRYKEPETFSQRKTGKFEVMPDRTQKKQGHIQYLLFDMQQKQGILEERKAAAAKNKRESRAKYGW